MNSNKIKLIQKNNIIKLVILTVLFSTVNLSDMSMPRSATAEDLPEYGLNDLYKVAAEKSNVLAAGKEDVLIAGIQKSKSISALIPDFYTIGTYRGYSESKKVAAGFIIQPDNAVNWGAGVGQNFSLGGREFFDLRIKKSGIKKSEADFDTLNENYFLGVATTYYNILKAEKLLSIARNNLKRLEKHRDTSKIRYQVGEVTTTVVLRAEAEVSKAKSELAKALNTLTVQRANLIKITSIENNFKLVKTPYEVDNSIKLPELKETAFKNRSELKSISIQKQIAEDRIKFTRSSFFPELIVEGVYSGAKAYPSTAFAIKHSMYGQISLKLDLFEGGRRRAELKEAKARLRQSELFEKDMIDSVILEVETAYYNSLTQRSVLAEIQDQYKLAKENYKHISAQFKEGFASNIDVTDANNFLFSTEQKLADVKNDYEMSHLIIKRVTGKFLSDIKEELKPVKGEKKNEKI